MIMTTTPFIEGRRITEYKGVVFGGRSNTYEQELMQARQTALKELSDRAAALGADAVVGIDIDYETLGSNNGMLMVTASGTAVRIE